MVSILQAATALVWLIESSCVQQHAFTLRRCQSGAMFAAGMTAGLAAFFGVALGGTLLMLYKL